MHHEKEPKRAEPGVVQFEDAVSLTGFGKYNIALMLTCGGCLLAVITETMSMSYILPAAQCDLDLTLSDKGILSAISFLGVVLSSHLWGFIGDAMGRRNLIVVTMYISFAMSLLSSITPYVWLFIVFRFFNGFFIGGASAVIYAYLGEFNDNSHRARMLSWAAVFVAVAATSLPGMAWLILPMKWSFEIPFLAIIMRPWRLLIIIYGFPTIIFATALVQFPESPKFLWVCGDSSKSLAVLRRIYVCNTGNPEYMYLVRNLATPTEHPPMLDEMKNTEDKSTSEKVLRVFKTMWKQTAPLFRSPLASKTAMTSVLQFGVFASSSGFLMWVPDLLNKVSHFVASRQNETVMVCQALEAYKGSNLDEFLGEPNCSDAINEEVFTTALILGVLFTLTYLFLGTVIHLTGKLLLLIGLLLLTGFGSIFINFAQGYYLIICSIALFVISGSGVSVINTIVVDIYPTQFRAMAMALSLMMGRVGAMAGSHVMGYLLEYYCPYTFYIFGIEHLILLIIALMIPIPLLPWRVKKIET